ncbi:hypothetical protein JHL18_23610 [Clostridium sp. YIM B02505]|uniref:Yip1 domain-containing protein n=1 Tax=Clostridium yunnanense TaxID=2800325 RepID=A0ABS1EW54_9CLOT|nr:hypothetical protein [Clostridium yunnanense]MBK1813607.1 hypothetical protein [Clostridium yunnanense]
MNKDIFVENLKDLISEKNFNEVFKKSVKLIKPSKSRVIILLALFCILIGPIFYLVIQDETSTKVIELVDMSNDILMGIFGISFTGYALFQALLGANALKQMLLQKIGKSSNLKTYNMYFFICSTLYLFLIVCNYVIKIIIETNINLLVKLYIPELYYNILITFFLMIYILLNIFSMLETKSLVLNMYFCFNTSVFSEGLEIISNENQQEESKGNNDN